MQAWPPNVDEVGKPSAVGLALTAVHDCPAEVCDRNRGKNLKVALLLEPAVGLQRCTITPKIDVGACDRVEFLSVQGGYLISPSPPSDRLASDQWTSLRERGDDL